MISQTDLQGRLRLLRYGLVVLVIVTFLVALLAPYAAVRPYADAAGQSVQIMDFLGTALLYTVIVAVVATVVYFVYQNVLQRSMPSP
ncbi:MAG: hypothetical protein IT319_22085 [Anaerolineae bacterium]|nr:hypothetical protein [Anaerolineae bacterium]